MTTVKNTFTIPARIKCSMSAMETIELSVKCLKLTSKAPERRQWYHSVAFCANFEHILNLILTFLLLTLTM